MSTVSTPVPAPPSRLVAAGRFLADLQRRMPLLQTLGVVVIFIYGASTLEGLSSASSIRLILVLAALAGLAAIGQTVLILLGGFDLSIAGFIVGGALMVTQVAERFGMSFVTALIVAVIAAGSLGGLAGYICHRLKINPLIITLAFGTIAVGLAQVLTPGGLTYGARAPEWLVKLAAPGSSTLGVSVPPLVVIWVIAAILMAVFLQRTVAGRRLMATGANQRGAEFSLIKTRRLWTCAFAFSAIVSVFVGILIAGSGGAITNQAGDPYLFQSVVAVIVGGTVFGGPGSYSRTVIGALFLTVLNIVLVGHGATAADQQIIYGATILIAVAVYSREARLRDQI